MIVAGLLERHSHHLPSAKVLRRIIEKKEEAYLTAHSLAECYSVLSGYPIKPQITPQAAVDLIETNIKSHFHLVELTAADYEAVFERLIRLKLRGGIIYDALIFQAALKKKVQKIITWNTSDFERLLLGESITISHP